MPSLGCTWMGELEAEAGRKKAHTFRSVEQKRRIVEETLKAGVSVSSVGRAHGINANQVFQWRKLYRGGRDGCAMACATLFAGFTGTMGMSDFSLSFITAYDPRPSLCGHTPGWRAAKGRPLGSRIEDVCTCQGLQTARSRSALA